MAEGKSIARVNWLDHIHCTEVKGSLSHSVPLEVDCLTIADEHQKLLRSRIWSKGLCPYCAEPLAKEHQEVAERSTFYVEALMSCRICGFWQLHSNDSLMGRYWTVPYARGFQPELQTPALVQLSREIQNAPEKIYGLGPTRFEVLVGGILADFFDCEVKHVGRTGDGGIDLMVLDADDPLLVQVKRRTRADATEGVEVVKNLFASLYAVGSNRGMLVTSAQRFTRGAKSWVRLPALRDSGYELDLVDIERVIDMTRTTTSSDTPPWQCFLEAREGVSFALDSPALETRIEDERLVVASRDFPKTEYVFARADRDCCTLVEHHDDAAPGKAASREQASMRSIGGFEFTELVRPWPRSICDEVFSFLAGPNDEMRVPVNP